MPTEMNLSDYIEALKALLEEHGDLKVLTHREYTVWGAYQSANPPQLRYRKILTKREHVEKFWNARDDDEACDHRGEPVIQV